jgi:Holliday junction DNA helicase RuvA
LITSVNGTLASVGEDKVVIKTDGRFSYEVMLPRFMIRRLLGRVGEPIELYTYHYLEGGHGGSNMIPRLVGFPSVEEKEFFEKFITVPDIGVRKALRCFVISIAEIAGAIENGDVKTLESLPGIGRRSAQKIVAELGGKVAKFALIREGEEKREPQAPIGIKEEVTEVLLQLGYNPREAQEMIAKALKAAPDISIAEDLLDAVYRQRAEGK